MPSLYIDRDTIRAAERLKLLGDLAAAVRMLRDRGLSPAEAYWWLTEGVEPERVVVS